MPQSYPNCGVRKLEYLSYSSCMVVWGLLQGMLILNTGQSCVHRILMHLKKLSSREVLCKKTVNAKGLWAGHWLPLLLMFNKLIARNWMEFAKSYKKCQVILRPETIDFYSPPADTCFPQFLLCQDRVTWGQCHPWKQPQGRFSSNSITFGMSPMPRLCYRWSNKSTFSLLFFFKVNLYGIPVEMLGWGEDTSWFFGNSTRPGGRECRFPIFVLCGL